MIEHGKRDARTWASATGLSAWLNGTLFVPMQPSAEHAGVSPSRQGPASGGRQQHDKQGDRSQPRRQQSQAWHATAAETISRLGLSGTAALGSMAAVGSISEYLWAAAASVTGSGAAGTATEVVSAAAQPCTGDAAIGGSPRQPGEMQPARKPVLVEVSGAQLDGPVAWSTEQNAFVAHVVAGKVAHCEQQDSTSTYAPSGLPVASSSATGATLHAAQVSPDMDTALGRHLVTIRIKGQAPGAADTVVTVEVS